MTKFNKLWYFEFHEFLAFSSIKNRKKASKMPKFYKIQSIITQVFIPYRKTVRAQKSFYLPC